MKQRVLILLASLLVLGWQGYAQTYRLHVVNGSGDGNYTPGDTVHIWANPNPSGQVFQQWTGDTDNLSDADAAHTTLTMPAADLSVTAIYKDAPVWTATREVIQGAVVYYYFPKNHKGVITLYHGTGGSAAGWTNIQVENRLFCEDAVAAGYAVVSTESIDRVNKQWNTSVLSMANPDVQRVQMILDTFKARGYMCEADPVYGLGMSNGGQFVPLVAALLDFKAAAIYCAPGLAPVMAVTHVPTLWALQENDQRISNPMAIARYQTLSGRGIDAELYVNPPSPVYPLRFWRIPRLSAADSQQIYTDLKENGFLDDSDYQIYDPAISGWEAVIRLKYAAYRNAISDQLTSSYAAHKFYSDRNNKTIAFFDAHR